MLLMKRDNIILIGMPGAGKSTLGIVMAKKLGMRFVDTDLLIQEGTDSLLSELFLRQARLGDLPPTALLSGLCVPRLAYAVCKQAGLALRGETCGTLNRAQIAAIGHTLRHYALPITGRKGLDRAQVTAGGIRCDEFDPLTMASTLVPGLHATGEVLNVDGDCGGYNLMFAWASGLLAGWNGRGAAAC